MKIFFLPIFLQSVLSCPEDRLCRSCGEKPGVCGLCFDSYLSDSSRCQPLHPASVIANCETYAFLAPFTAFCSLCVPGFYVAASGSACLGCEDPNCAHCEAFGTFCVACHAGFRPQGGTCVNGRPSDPLCEVSNSKGVCLRCKIGWAIEGEICQDSEPGCKVRKGENCLECHDGAWMRNDRKCEGVPKTLPHEEEKTKGKFKIGLTICGLCLTILAGLVHCGWQKKAIEDSVAKSSRLLDE